MNKRRRVAISSNIILTLSDPIIIHRDVIPIILIHSGDLRTIARFSSLSRECRQIVQRLSPEWWETFIQIHLPSRNLSFTQSPRIYLYSSYMHTFFKACTKTEAPLKRMLRYYAHLVESPPDVLRQHNEDMSLRKICKHKGIAALQCLRKDIFPKQIPCVKMYVCYVNPDILRFPPLTYMHNSLQWHALLGSLNSPDQFITALNVAPITITDVLSVLLSKLKTEKNYFSSFLLDRINIKQAVYCARTIAKYLPSQTAFDVLDTFQLAFPETFTLLVVKEHCVLKNPTVMELFYDNPNISKDAWCNTILDELHRYRLWGTIRHVVDHCAHVTLEDARRAFRRHDEDLSIHMDFLNEDF